ncbi:MAG: glycosyltransferase family 4 protein [bacterium]|nr:glycosyltransferase family 4 protein [bacterium]
MILVLAPYVPHPPSHGGSIRSRVLLDALVEEHGHQGREVHLAAPVQTEGDRSAAAELASLLGLTFHELPVAGAASSPARKLFCWARGRSELFARRWSPAAPAAVRELVDRLAPTLLVADSSFVLPLVPTPAPTTLLYLHNLESDIFARRDGQRRGFGERISRWFEARGMASEERRHLRRATLAVTVSERDAELARDLVPNVDVVAVPNSVDLERLPFAPPRREGPPRLLFVGGLDYPPNREAVTELVERHLPTLQARHPGLVLRLVGRDDSGYARRFPERDGVELLGLVDDLLPHYRASDAAYLPIRSGGGTRIKILEAWALGLPVIATGIAAEGLAGEDGQHLRRFETVEQGADALDDVLAGQGAMLAQAARGLVEEHYSHAAATAQLCEVVARAVGRATSR